MSSDKLSRFVIVVGLSGAGKSQAMKSFEDLGFHCLDNLPPRLTPEVVSLCERSGIRRLVLALDVRSHGPFGDAMTALHELREKGVAFELLYLDATDEAIIRRYSETRRRHPYEHLTVNLADAIAADRRETAELRAQADRVWDTSPLTQMSLKARIVATYSEADEDHALIVHVLAFGFKYGVPPDADLVLDMRFLPNPNWVPELRSLTGEDARVAEYLGNMPETQEFLRRWYDLLDFLLPRYIEEGRSRLTIGIGCTGGQHRSVYIAREIEKHLKRRELLHVTFERRDTSALRA